MKKVTTLIRQSPFNTSVPTEALRMSLGLTLANNKVTVVFVEDGVYMLASSASESMGYPDLKKHLSTLQDFHCKLAAEKESLEMRGIKAGKINAEIKSREEIDQLLEESDQVIAF